MPKQPALEALGQHRTEAAKPALEATAQFDFAEAQRVVPLLEAVRHDGPADRSQFGQVGPVQRVQQWLLAPPPLAQEVSQGRHPGLARLQAARGFQQQGGSRAAQPVATGALQFVVAGMPVVRSTVPSEIRCSSPTAPPWMPLTAQLPNKLLTVSKP